MLACIAVLGRTEENAVEMALTKAADWYYEKEFQVIARSEVDDGHPLRLHGQRIRLPENALASVVVGCEGDYQAIHRIVDQHAPGLPVRRIKRVPNRSDRITPHSDKANLRSKCAGLGLKYKGRSENRPRSAV
jgi:hypothetical protein